MPIVPPAPRTLGSARRKAMNVAPQQLVSERLLSPDHALPLVIEPAVSGVDLVAWATREREALERKLLQYGALLFRGFGVASVEQFDHVIAALSPGALEYMFRASPRTRVGGNIYTSTDYPADQMIFPHNEHSYSPRFPLRLFFYCQLPSETGGETPIGSTRAVKARISADIEARFREKGVLYVRNYGDGFGLPWQSVFQSADRSEVEAYCASVGIEVEWKENNRLRTRQRGPAVVRHPRTGEEVWFNHATFFTSAPCRRPSAIRCKATSTTSTCRPTPSTATAHRSNRRCWRRCAPPTWIRWCVSPGNRATCCLSTTCLRCTVANRLPANAQS